MGWTSWTPRVVIGTWSPYLCVLSASRKQPTENWWKPWNGQRSNYSLVSFALLRSWWALQPYCSTMKSFAFGFSLQWIVLKCPTLEKYFSRHLPKHPGLLIHIHKLLALFLSYCVYLVFCPMVWEHLTAFIKSVSSSTSFFHEVSSTSWPTTIMLIQKLEAAGKWYFESKGHL